MPKIGKEQTIPTLNKIKYYPKKKKKKKKKIYLKKKKKTMGV